MNTTKFPLKENEINADSWIRTKGSDYKKTIKETIKYFEGFNYLTHKHIGWRGVTTHVRVIANVLCKNLVTDIDLACLVFFPRKRRLTLEKFIDRIARAKEYWGLVAVILPYHGHGSFLFVYDRIFNADKNTRIFTLNLDTGRMKSIHHADGILREFDQ